ncbi:MAG: hypothetical protein JWP48_5907 [Actinoallomurus sp.]|jgi:hypothetical protein|nr:hypothetical protein [Actinoallomurus sp.]
MRLLDNHDVRAVLDMRGALAALRRGCDDLRRGQADSFVRLARHHLDTARYGRDL